MTVIVSMTANLPTCSELVAFTELLELVGIEEPQAREILSLGWVEPERTAAEEFLFRRQDVYRLIKLTRICRDLDISYMGGSIIVDLVDRVEGLEARIRELEQLL
jgi:chaperone modulatory protein CbpM